MLKIITETTQQKQSVVRTKSTREEALELAEALHKHGIIVSVVSSEYKSKIPAVNSLLQWLVSLANLSDGLCRLIWEQFISHGDESPPGWHRRVEDGDIEMQQADAVPPNYPILRAVILADSYLPKSESDALHSLLMALLADPFFKKAFAIAFTSSYRQLYHEFVTGIGSSSATILTFGVQFFNRASFVKLLVADYELLEVLMTSVLETPRRKLKEGAIEIPFDGTLEHVSLVLAPEENWRLHQWDLFALGIQRSRSVSTLQDVNLPALESEALTAGFTVLKPSQDSLFLNLAPDTDLPGRFELDVSSPVFVFRRYMSGLLDLRYALQIDGVSECFVLEKNGTRFAEFLLYLSYIQGVCSEVRQTGDHVLMESRGWVVAVEFVSTASDVFSWIISNVFKNVDDKNGPEVDARLRYLIENITRPILEAHYFWMASSGKYFPPLDFICGDALRSDQAEKAVSCHYPVHRTLAQLVRTLCDSNRGLELFCSLVCSPGDDTLWVHPSNSPIGFWHRVHLIEPALQAIVWDAQVHSGMWVRNGMAVVNHSMNYGEPPFCLRFRDVDLLLVQFGFQLMGIDWMMASIKGRFGIEEWIENEDPENKDPELMVTECLTLLGHLATELPPKVSQEDALRSLVPYLRREIVQRLCVGPCAHSDLSKIATEFFLAHENLFSNNFSSGTVLDQVLKEVCAEPGFSSSSGGGGDSATGGKFQYRLKPELYAEYNPSFIHLTRKQHEFAHENWFQNRVRLSKLREQQQDDGSPSSTHSSWLDFPIVNMFLPCPIGFRRSRYSILHPGVCRLIYEACWRAVTDAKQGLNVLTRSLHLLTLQLYVVEEIRYLCATPVKSEADQQDREEATALIENYLAWATTPQPSIDDIPDQSRVAIFQLLLKLNPWSVNGGNGCMVRLDGDQKHECGRGIDWLLHRFSRISETCRAMGEQHKLTEITRDEVDHKAILAQRRKEAQMRAILQMQQRQKAFAEQMKMMSEAAGEDDESESTDDGMTGADHDHNAVSMSSDDGSNDVNMSGEYGLSEADALPECAMCHSVDSEDSFMCYVGFAQCSAVLSRLNGGSIGRFLSTPMDEMHVGEDVPMHVRLCGHSVHQTCWKSYHSSQFQRAITGGHHRHALNAVDVTKKEFLCPLCKSISNVLIPTTTNEMNRLLQPRSVGDGAVGKSSIVDMGHWLDAIGREPSLNAQQEAVALSTATTAETNGDTELALQLNPPPHLVSPALAMWLDEGLSSLCMAIHKVAFGAMQKSNPERYSASACNALFHTLLCTVLTTPDGDQSKPEHLFLQAMRFLPLMLKQVVRPGSQASAACGRRQISHLLFYGGSDVLADGTVTLENEQPSTQTQTRKQSQWGKVRWPTKPLLLCHLGSVLVKGLLLAESDDEAVFIGRLLVLARIVQSLLWYAITRDKDFTDSMADNLEESEESISLFIASFFEDPNTSKVTAADTLERLYLELVSQCQEQFAHEICASTDKYKLLNAIACEVAPMARVAAFLMQAVCASSVVDGKNAQRVPKPSSITHENLRTADFVKLDNMLFMPVITRWVQRFQQAYAEMHDPQGILQQWLASMNLALEPANKVTFPLVLARDLHTMHSSLSVVASGSNRTRYLRSLPRAYVKFYSELAKRRCNGCNQFPARPAVCLLCGALLCAASTCPSIQSDKSGYPEDANPGACTVHAKKCGRGSGMFLLVLEGAVLLVYWKLAAYVGSLYVDEYGEEFGERNRELNKGRPLYLQEDRRQRLLRLWTRHEIPNEVVKIQNSSERVIRNSHY